MTLGPILFFAWGVLMGETGPANEIQRNTCELVDMGGYYNLADPACGQ